MADDSPQNNVISVVFVLLCVAGFVLLLPLLNPPRRPARQMKNSANLRGIAQSFAIYGNSNNDYLPGFSPNGSLLTASQMPYPASGQSGASVHARLSILLHEQYIGGDLLLNPQDSLTKWVSGQPCTSANVSYAGLAIGNGPAVINTTHHEGRAAEWKNNANSQAVLLTDRLFVLNDNADKTIQSVWTTSPGDWKGNIVWGDVHAEFAQTNRGFQTRYLATTTTYDNLFATFGSPGVTDSTTDSGSNAMMVYY